MFRRLLIGTCILIGLASLANAQYIIIGPPDDQTIVDTSIHPSAAPLRPTMPIPAATGSSVVTSLDLSQLDCSLFPSICGYVDVLDGSGNPIPGFNADSFCVFQNGVPIPSFTVQQLTAGNCPTSVCLVVDVSGSMTTDGRLTAAKSAMNTFVNNMDVYDQVAIVTFSTCWNVLVNFTSNQTTLHNAINGLTAGGNTAAFDGVYKGVDITRFQLGSKAVIAFTDGVENRSHLCAPNPPDGVTDNTYADDSTAICNLANTGSVPIYTFNLGPIDNTWFNPEAMQAFATGTGGFWAHAPTGASMDSLYTKIKQRLCSRYYICYQSIDTVQNGDIHWTKICRKNGPNCTMCDSLSCQEKAPPEIVRTPATINLSNSCQSPNASINMCAWVTDDDTPKANLVVTLFYRTGPSSYTSVTMTPTGPVSDSTFCATIPASVLKCQSGVDYYITASDGQATVSAPALNPQVSPYHFNLCPTNPPVANAGADQTIFQCNPAQICWAAGCTDADGDLKLCELVSGPGTFNGSQICFTPTNSLDYEFILKATDSCNQIDYDTVVIHYTKNSAPTVSLGADQNVFQCAAAQICVNYTLSDPDNNLNLESLISGPGSIDTVLNRVCFTPAVSGANTIIVQVTDACGLSKRDTVVVTVTLNSAPVCTVPANETIAQCTPTQVCRPYSATDVNGNFRSCSIVSGPGSLSGGNWCYTPSGTQTVNVTIRCEDSCNAYCESSFQIQFNINSAPVIAFGNDTTIFQCTPAQICANYTVSDADNNLTLESLISGPGSIDTVNNRVCFTPAVSGANTIIVQATDACGATKRDTIVVTVNLNAAPTVSLGADQNVFQCAATSICVPYTLSDPNNNLNLESLISGPGSIDTVNNQVCFTPAASGANTIIVQVTDACGLTARDTVVINVTLNGAPTIAFGNDTTLFQCTASSICVTYAVSDPNGIAKITESMISGYGSIDTLNNRVCFTPASSGSYQIIVQAMDSCGATDRDTINVTVTLNSAPVATNPPASVDTFMCASAQICRQFAATDVNGGALTWTKLSGSGTVTSGGLWCFTPATSGSYSVTATVADACGAKDTVSMTYNVTLNSAPIIALGANFSTFQCAPAQICLPYTVSDANNNVTVEQIFSGPGVIDTAANTVCYTPPSGGTYTTIVSVTDACGLLHRDTIVVTVTANGAPVITFGNDTSLFLCTPTQVCMSYSISDPNGLGKLTEVLVSGSGSLDSANNKICFTPAVAGIYDFIVSVTDSCGATDRDTIRATITFGQFADITCPAGPISASLCATGQVCQAIAITPPGATVTTTFGTYSGGNLCFQADTSGTYVIRVIASASCGADTCFVTFNVDIGSAANITCPPTQSRFVCAAGTPVCTPITVLGSGATVTVSPVGTYASGSICFNADTSGHYVIKIKASTTCGSDSCFLITDVTIDAAPVAVNPVSPKDTFMCAAAQVCYQFSASDVNGGPLTWTKLSGDGSVTSGGLWCFTPTVSGSYSVTAKVADSCGKADTTTLTYNVTLNSAPNIAFGADTSVTLCVSGSICVPYTISDPNNNVSLEQLLSGPGSIDTVLNKVCFTPASSGSYTLIVNGQDACGAYDRDTIVVNVTINPTATVSCPGAQSKFLCAAGQICFPVTVTGVSPVVSVTPIGSYSAGTVCFTADTSGVYNIQVSVTSACGSASCTYTATVTINQPPVATNPPVSVDTAMCASAQICRQFAATDPNGGALTWTRVSGDGTVSAGGLWCFTPPTSGSYSVVAAVADSCGAADTVTMTYNVTLNAPPLVQLGNDTTLFQCANAAVCVSYTVSDPNNNANLEQLISGPGSIDTVANKVCFTPAGTGTYTIIVGVTDACGATDRDTVVVTIDANDPPVVNAGVDKTIFQCTPTQYCFPITTSDPDNNIDSVKLISGPGTLNAGQVCFTPGSSGISTFIIKAFDHCGLTAVDTVKVTVTLNSAPVCNMPNDTTKFFQCAPAQVSLPVSGTDINGNFSHCQITSGPGSLSGGNWTYTPSGSQTVKVVVQCLDSCGASCVDSFYVKFSINRVPLANAGHDTSFFLCSSGNVCVPVFCSDMDNNLQLCELVSAVGTYNSGSGMVCINADYGTGTPKTFPIIMKVTDSCGAVDFDTANVTVQFNHPPVVQGPPNLTVYLDQIGQVCFDVAVSDQDNNITSVTTSLGTYNSGIGQVCFNADTTGLYCVIVTAQDQCNVVRADTVCLNVQIDECIHVQIEKVHNAIQGQHKLVNIYLNGAGKPVGGFEFLIAYDASSLSAMAATEGSLFTGCAWEYFTYRFGPFGNCGSGCPSGMIRISGVAETNNGAYHPTCLFDGQTGVLATIDFLVSNDRTLECQYAPVQFFWLGCGDNAFSAPAGDTLWISRFVYDFEFNDITDNSFGFPGYLGAPDQCLIGGGPGKPAPVRCVDFTNGGVDIVCADSIDARGDVNLNGLSYEIADAVMFTNYFIQGLSAFVGHVDGSVAATDVNGDGLTLTVGDLVYLIRVIVGDAAQLPKLNPSAVNQVTFSVVDNALTITDASSGVGAVYLIVEGDVHPSTIGDGESMDMVYRYDGAVTRILIATRGRNSLGTGKFVQLDGMKSIKSIEAGSFEGYSMKSTLTSLPTEFALSQNYPNPFNPVTTLDFSLPHAADWKVQIYNILGQVVQTWGDHGEAGYYHITWDAASYASGVYFYRLTAGSYTSTKKMVLLK